MTTRLGSRESQGDMLPGRPLDTRRSSTSPDPIRRLAGLVRIERSPLIYMLRSRQSMRATVEHCPSGGSGAA